MKVTLKLPRRDPSAAARDDRRRVSATSREDVNHDFVKPGDTGSKRSIFFEFLHFAIAIGGTYDQRVIVDFVRLPIKTPKRPA